MQINPHANPAVEPPGQLQLTAGDITVKVDQGEIESADAERLVPALLGGDVARVTGDQVDISVSLKGITAALVKIDDVQGRIGSARALGRRGSRAESSVPPAPATPVVRLAILPAKREADTKFFDHVLQYIASSRPGQDSSCWPGASDSDTSDYGYIGDAVARLSNRSLLVLHQAPYPAEERNPRWCAWIVDDRAPWQPRPVTFSEKRGEPDAGLVGRDVGFSAIATESGLVGLLQSNYISRALDNCSTSLTWGWTGREVALVKFETSALCDGFPGGVPLRQWHVDTMPPV